MTDITLKMLTNGEYYFLPDYQTASLGFEFGDVGAATISYPVTGVNADKLGIDSIIIAYDDGVEMPDGRWHIQAGSGAKYDEVPVTNWIGKSIVDALRRVVVLPTAAEPGSDQRFDTATPGGILDALFAQAQARGAMTGFTWDFTSSVDSSGTAWAKVISLTYRIGVKYLDVIRNMVDQGLLEFRLEGTTIRAFNVGGALGTDYSTGPTIIELAAGRDYSEMPWKTTAEERAKYAMVVGDDKILVERTNAATPDGPFGREEVSISQGGTKDIPTLILVGDNNLENISRIRDEYTRQLIVNDDSPQAGSDFLVGDWVRDRVGTTSEVYRVRSIVLSVGAANERTASIVLNDKLLEQEIRMARRVNGIIGGASVDGGGNGLPAEETVDTTTPDPPTGLALGSAIYVDGGGVTRALVNASWVKPTNNTDGSVFTDLMDYEVEYQLQGLTEWRTIITGGYNTQIGNLEPGSGITVRVRTRDLHGHVSDWVQAAHTTEADILPPPVPSTPVVEDYLGALTVTWDGLGVGSVTMPLDFRVVEIHRSLINDFTPDDTTVISSFLYPRRSSVLWSGLTYGTTYYCKLVAVDRAGNRSAASAQASGVPRKLTNSDIEPLSISTGSVDFDATDLGAAQVFYGPTAPQAVADRLSAGDIWTDSSSNNQLKRWDGDSWELIDDTRIAQAILDAASATSIAQSKITSYFEPSAPENAEDGDLWIDTDDGNLLYRYVAAFGSAPATNLITNPSGRNTSGTVTVRENLCTNPNFETDVTGWVPTPITAANTPTRVTTNPFSGTARLSSTGNNNYSMIQVENAMSGFVAGDVVSVSARLRSDGQVPAQAVYFVRTAERVYIGGEYLTWAPDANGWMLVSGSVTVPSGTAGIILQLGVQVSSANYLSTSSLGVDEVLVEKSASIQTYFDGSTPASGDFTYAWTGTASASVSQQLAPAIGTTWSMNGLAYYSATRDAIALRATAAQPSPYIAKAYNGLVGPHTSLMQTWTSDDSTINVSPYHLGGPGGGLQYPSASGETIRFDQTLTTDNSFVARVFSIGDRTAYIRVGLVPGDYEGSYFDGSYGGCEWTGTPDASSSSYLGAAWVEAQDQGIVAAIEAAASAQGTADGKVRTFAQDTEPTGMLTTDVGDLWVDTNDTNKLYRWSGTQWVVLDDTRIAALVQDMADAQADIAAATLAASDAQSTADSKMVIFYQTTPPVGAATGDLWIDTDDGNSLHRWSGSVWDFVDNIDIQTALTNAAAAQSSADGKIRSFFQASAPGSMTAGDVGDMWFETDNGNKAYWWDGDSWEAVPFGAEAIAPSALTVDTLVPEIRAALGQIFHDDFSDISRWQLFGGGGTFASVAIADSRTGGSVGRATGYVYVAHKTLIPFDPSQLYKVTIRIRANPDVAGNTTYAGVRTIGADGVTIVGVNSGNCYITVSAADVTGAWTEYVGYIKGTTIANESTPHTDPKTPAKLIDTARYLRPLMLLNYSGTTQVSEVDLFKVEAVPTGLVERSNIALAAINAALIEDAAIIRAKIGNLAVGTAQIDNLAVTDGKIQNLTAAKITTGELAAAVAIYAGDSLGFHAKVADTGFTAAGPDSNGVVQDRVRMGTATGDFFAIPDPADTSGEGSLASITESGDANFQGLSSAEDPVFEGRVLSEYLADKPAGIVTWGEYTGGTINNITTTYGLFEVNFIKQGSRLLRLSYSVQTYPTGSQQEVYLHVKYTTDGSTPSINSPNFVGQAAVGLNSASTFDSKMSMRVRGTSDITDGSLVRLLLCIQRGNGSGTISVVSGATWLIVEDTGREIGNGGTTNNGGGTTVIPTVQYDTGNLQAVWEATFQGDGDKRNDTTDVVQGYNSFNGIGKGAFGWNNIPNITGTVDRVDLYLYSNHWYYNTGGTAVINLHNTAAEPAGMPAKYGGKADWYVGGYPKPGAKWVTLPSDWFVLFKNSAVKGVTLGPPGTSTDLVYYGRFNSAASGGAYLRIWYTQ